MPLVLPSPETVVGAFAHRHSPSNTNKRPANPRPESMERPLFPAWSTVDDVKKAAQSAEKGVAGEVDKASNKVQSKTGKIEMHSWQYFASCTFGGLMACVSIIRAPDVFVFFFHSRPATGASSFYLPSKVIKYFKHTDSQRSLSQYVYRA